MNKKGFQIIRGGKSYPKSNYIFVSAIATKTRLMGVIALKIHWRTSDNLSFVQWFLLDAEEHGIYDYISIKAKEEHELDMYTDRFMGSLGGKKVSITQKECIHLIKSYAKLNFKHNQPLPPPSFEYNFILKSKSEMSKEERTLLAYKIYENIDSPIQLINYFLMRTVANDGPGKRYLFGGQDITPLSKFTIVNKASVLLKNNVQLVKKLRGVHIYSIKSIIDADIGYVKAISLIEIRKLRNEYKVVKATLLDKQVVTYEMISSEILNPEHLLVFKIKDKEDLSKKLVRIKPRLLKYEFNNGIMYVEFRRNNDHVKREEYYIGGDLLAIYFITDFNELVICYYDFNDLYDIKSTYTNSSILSNLKLIKNISVKGSIIYQYAQKEAQDFISYLDSVITE